MRPQLPDHLAVTYEFYACTSRRPPRGEKDCVETLATTATITTADHNYGRSPLAKGTAILGPDDRFSMRVAKEVALGRALKEYATGTACGPFVTKTGRVLTDADVERLADEAAERNGPSDFAQMLPEWRIKYNVEVRDNALAAHPSDREWSLKIQPPGEGS